MGGDGFRFSRCTSSLSSVRALPNLNDRNVLKILLSFFCSDDPGIGILKFNIRQLMVNLVQAYVEGTLSMHNYTIYYLQGKPDPCQCSDRIWISSQIMQSWQKSLDSALRRTGSDPLEEINKLDTNSVFRPDPDQSFF